MTRQIEERNVGDDVGVAEVAGRPMWVGLQGSDRAADLHPRTRQDEPSGQGAQTTA